MNTDRIDSQQCVKKLREFHEKQGIQIVENGLRYAITRHPPELRRLIKIVWRDFIFKGYTKLPSVATQAEIPLRQCLASLQRIAGIKFGSHDRIVSCYGLSCIDRSDEQALIGGNILYTKSCLPALLASLIIGEPVIVFHGNDGKTWNKWNACLTRSKQFRIRPDDYVIYVSKSLGDILQPNTFVYTLENFNIDTGLYIGPAIGYYSISESLFARALVNSVKREKDYQ